jgi:outer membrane protein assembly factor BamB
MRIVKTCLLWCWLGVQLCSAQDTLWACKIKKPVTLLPLLETSRYYVGNESGSLFCVDAESGRVLWETKIELKKANKKIKDAVKKIRTKSPNTKPEVKNGFLSMFVSNPNYIFGCNADDHVYALNKDNGVKIWEYKTEFDAEKFAPLFIYDNTIIFKTEDSCIIALNQDTGSEVWKYKCSGKVGALTIRDNEIHFPSSDMKIISLNARNGKEESKFVSEGISFNIDKGVSVIDNNYFALTDSGEVFCVSVRKKKEVWKQALQAKWFIEDDERLVCYSDSLMMGLKSKNGVLNWKVEGSFNDRTLPIIFNGKLYYHAVNKNKLMIINLKNGEYLRSFLVKGKSKVSPGINAKMAILCVEDKIFAIKNE